MNILRFSSLFESTKSDGQKRHPIYSQCAPSGLIVLCYTFIISTNLLIICHTNLGFREPLCKSKVCPTDLGFRNLAANLRFCATKELGKGFTERNLRNFRSFYLQFPNYEIWHARVPNLSWTHFRSLLSVENKEARYWYMNEAASESWSSRTLDRNICSQFYCRLSRRYKNCGCAKSMQV